MSNQHSGEDAGEEEQDGEKKGCAGKLATAGAIIFFVVGLMWFLTFGHRGCENWRAMIISPDRVHAAYFGESNGRPVAYIMTSVLMSADDHHDYLDDSTYRVDIYELDGGERVSLLRAQWNASQWLGTNGSVAWLFNRDTSIGLFACDVASGELLVMKDDIIAKNSGVLKEAIDTAYFDAKSGGALARTIGGAYFLIDPKSFAATPATIDSVARASLSNPGDTSLVVLSTAKLVNGSTIRLTRRGQVEYADSSGAEKTIGADFIRAGFLCDAASGMPVEAATPGSIVVLHYENDDENAPYLLTALAPDGKVLWRISGDGIDSDPPIRAAHRHRNSVIIINDSEILFLDAATGAELRRVEL